MHILVKDKRSGGEEWMPLEAAAKIMNLDAAEIEWALEEFGECESVDHIAIEPE